MFLYLSLVEQISLKDKKISKLSEIMLDMEKGLISSEKKRAALENATQVGLLRFLLCLEDTQL